MLRQTISHRLQVSLRILILEDPGIVKHVRENREVIRKFFLFM